MGLFGKKKDTVHDLDEIKNLTLGFKEKTKAHTEPEKKVFPAEQKIFTQITSVKEITHEPEYIVPKELKKETEAEEVQEKKTSSFERLMNLSKEPVDSKKILEQKKAAQSQNVIQKRGIIIESKKLNLEENGVEAEIQEEKKTEEKANENEIESPVAEEKILGENPIIVENSLNEEKKEETFEWMNQQDIEEPNEADFEKESVFARNKRKYAEEKTQTNKTLTPIDEIFSTLEEKGKIDTGEIEKRFGIETNEIEKIAKIFEEQGIIEINYPTSLTKKPILTLKNPVAPKTIQTPKGTVLESYQIEADYVPAQISITMISEEPRPIYTMKVPSIGKYTKKFLDFIKEEVAENMPIELEEITDPKKSKKLKERFFFELNSHLSKYFSKASKETLNLLSGILLHEMYGLGDIELLMGDDMLEEVGINSAKTPITVYHRVHGWLKTNLLPGSEEEINNLSSQIGRKVGREITVLNPILDAHLLSGDRVNATLFPVSSEGNTLTIRRFARKPWTIIDFIGRAHTMNSEMAAMLWLAMQYELNVLIAGGTASGKTSALNSLLALVPTYHRTISIEDVREIVLPKFLEWNWVPLVTRSPNPEGLGEVTMLDLMITSLRMRPDRIIVGEIRRKKG